MIWRTTCWLLKLRSHLRHPQKMRRTEKPPKISVADLLSFTDICSVPSQLFTPRWYSLNRTSIYRDINHSSSFWDLSFLYISSYIFILFHFHWLRLLPVEFSLYIRSLHLVRTPSVSSSRLHVPGLPHYNIDRLSRQNIHIGLLCPCLLAFSVKRSRWIIYIWSQYLYLYRVLWAGDTNYSWQLPVMPQPQKFPSETTVLSTQKEQPCLFTLSLRVLSFFYYDHHDSLDACCLFPCSSSIDSMF